MGYTTYFTGALKFKEPLTIEQEILLKSICDEIRLGPDKNPFPVNPGPVSYIDFELTEDKTGIQHSGSEKSYHNTEQVNFIIDVMRTQFPTFALEGNLLAQGEEVGDVWQLVIRDGRATHELICGPNLGVSNTFEFDLSHRKIESGSLYYDLFDGGYIHPKDLLVPPEQVKKVEDAIETIKQFLTQAIDNNLIEII